MSQESSSQDPSTVAASEAPQAGKASRIGATVVLALIGSSLLWYFAADRVTPYSSQARVQAFVVPVAAEVAGKVLAVHVRNDDDVGRAVGRTSLTREISAPAVRDVAAGTPRGGSTG